MVSEQSHWSLSFGNRLQKFDLVHQTVSYQEGTWARYTTRSAIGGPFSLLFQKLVRNIDVLSTGKGFITDTVGNFLSG